ncbi:hypothetical protein EYF80_050829 [Liparis tanakae]|uniref:Uncharacterized protein n=1 Tax=Liparis tanakae TaxID=230148 RepID=A0A4Z2FDP8_9TELE|nr:hypothetical protein EYF80_050829 [Liparis tanakae]
MEGSTEEAHKEKLLWTVKREVSRRRATGRPGTGHRAEHPPGIALTSMQVVVSVEPLRLMVELVLQRTLSDSLSDDDVESRPTPHAGFLSAARANKQPFVLSLVPVTAMLAIAAHLVIVSFSFLFVGLAAGKLKP